MLCIWYCCDDTLCHDRRLDSSHLLHYSHKIQLKVGTGSHVARGVVHECIQTSNSAYTIFLVTAIKEKRLYLSKYKHVNLFLFLVKLCASYGATHSRYKSLELHGVP